MHSSNWQGVSIPLISGLGFYSMEAQVGWMKAVSIPLISGLGFYGRGARFTQDGIRLNPFDFRARFLPTDWWEGLKVAESQSL